MQRDDDEREWGWMVLLVGPEVMTEAVPDEAQIEIW